MSHLTQRLRCEGLSFIDEVPVTDQGRLKRRKIHCVAVPKKTAEGDRVCCGNFQRAILKEQRIRDLELSQPTPLPEMLASLKRNASTKTYLSCTSFSSADPPNRRAFPPQPPPPHTPNTTLPDSFVGVKPHLRATRYPALRQVELRPIAPYPRRTSAHHPDGPEVPPVRGETSPPGNRPPAIRLPYTLPYACHTPHWHPRSRQ